jgi:hypothetical protein
MAYTYHGTSNLIALPNRTVQTYPSGLVRVERSYVCRKADAGRNRSKFQVGDYLPNDDGAPAIDGLYIFPAAQETVRDDGFVEFRVSAYGRINTTGREKIEDEYNNDSLSEDGFTYGFITKSQILTQEFVIFKSQNVPPTTNKIPGRPVVVFGTGGELALSQRRYQTAIRSYSSRDFGTVSEVTLVYAPFLLFSFSA